MRLLRVIESIVFPDGVLEVGARLELLEVEGGKAIVRWRGKLRRVNPAALEDVGEYERARHLRFA